MKKAMQNNGIKIFAEFSYQIQYIIDKYPFNYREEYSIADNKTSSL